MTKGIDFTNCPRVFDRAYNGANGKKIAVEYDGRPYEVSSVRRRKAY